MTVASAPSREQVERFLPWVVAVALFMQQLDSTIINTAVPTMAASLGVASLSLKSVVTSYTIGLAVFIPLSGWVADRFGTRRVFGLAVFMFTLGSLLCGLSLNLPMLIASRVLQGAGAAIMLPVGRLALLLAFPNSEMLRVMNFVIIPALLGPLFGPLMGGVIVHWMPWRMIFLLNLPFGALGLYLVRRFMPDHRDAHAGVFDKLGFLLFGSGVALLSYVLEIFGQHSLPTNGIVVLLLLSFVLLGGYGWHAQTHKNPLLPLSLFGIRTFRASVVGGFVTRLGISGMPFLLPLLYQLGLGYAPWQAGLLTMPQAAAAIGMKLLTPKILSRFGHRTVLLANTVLIGAMILVFSGVRPGTPVWVILLLSFLQGSFSALQFTSMNSLAYADTSDAEASDASVIASTAQQLSISIGVASASLVTGWFLGGIHPAASAEFIRALHHAFLTLGMVTILSALTFLRLHPHDGNNVSNRVPNHAEE
ncbi:MAG: DHA2 family efflux MFS transporter permease subunit [Verrucomicrobiae bacterium]|nr:DHA2 family efflux MFS transporter permease subunit [Verrucomicrobiae bacterium]